MDTRRVALLLWTLACAGCAERVVVGYDSPTTTSGAGEDTAGVPTSSGAASSAEASGATSSSTGSGGSASSLPEAAEPFWEVDFDSGSASQWEDEGGYIYVDNDARYRVASDHTLSGSFALEATVVSIGDQLPQAMLLREFELYEGYYSASFCVRENYDTTFWGIMKIRGDGPFGDSTGEDRFDIDLSRSPDDGRLHLQLDEHGGEAVLSPLAVPIDTWFEVEVFYRSTPDNHGRLVVWQDGVQVFDTGERPTSGSAWVGLGVGVAAWRVSPLPASIWIDDVRVAGTR